MIITFYLVTELLVLKTRIPELPVLVIPERSGKIFVQRKTEIPYATKFVKNELNDKPEKGHIDAGGHCLANREKLGSK